MGHAVADAGNAGEALELAANSRFDILITDIGLPDMSGLELARRLRGQWPELPVIIASGRGHGDAPPLEGPIGYLEKPFTMQMLRKALAAFTAAR
jgi:DNA-binding response OmpR family regulator